MSKTTPVYPLTERMGACVILNMEHFKDDLNARRAGTKYDKKLIEKTFATFGYDVYPVQNPTEDEITIEINKVLAKDQEHDKESSSFICFILSHGSTKNMITTQDNKDMYLNEIIKLADVAYLKGKPKIFVIQACRGNRTDKGLKAGKEEETDQSNIEFEVMMPAASQPDFMLIFATAPGYYSYRHKKGTVFIRMMCNILKENRDKAAVCSLIQQLILTLSCIPFRPKDEKRLCLQVPCFSSTLRKSLMLHKSGRCTKVKTIKGSKTDDFRRRVVRLLQAVKGLDENNKPFHTSENSVYDKILLEEPSSCYDLSDTYMRHCLVINKTDKGTATQDCIGIKDAMELLKFKVHISMNDDRWREYLEKCMLYDGKVIGCFFCFIQMDADTSSLNQTLLTGVVGTVKNKSALLHKPSVFIIQTYRTIVHDQVDYPNHNGNSTLALPVRYSKESDVLIVQVSAVEDEEINFIKLFCAEYPDVAKTVHIMDFLEGVLPGKYEDQCNSLHLTVWSSMRKHLLITESFNNIVYRSEDWKTEQRLCKELEKIVHTLENRIKKSSANDSTVIEDIPDALATNDSERHQKAAWRKINVVCGCIMFAVGILIVILSSVQLGIQNSQHCDDSTNLTLNASLMCEHRSSHQTVLAIEVISFMTNILLTIVVVVVLIDAKMTLVYKNTTKKRRKFEDNCANFVYGFNMLCCIIDIIKILTSGHNFKDKYVFSICILMLHFFLIISICTGVLVTSDRKQDNDRSDTHETIN